MQQSQAFRSGLFWSGALTFVLMGVAGVLYGPALPALARGNGITVAEAGFLLSLHAGGGLLGLFLNMALGGLSARVALGLAAAGSGVIAAGLGWPATMAGAVLLGMGYSLTAVIFNRRFLMEMDDRGPAMVGLLNAIFGIGAIAGPLVLIAAGGSVSIAYGVVAAGALALMPLARGRGPTASAAGGAGMAAALRAPALLIVGATGVGIEAAMIGLGPAALIARGATETGAALVASVFFVCFLLGRLSLYWIAPRIAPLRLLGLAFAATGTAAMLAGIAWPAVFYGVAGASIGMQFPAYFVGASARYGTDERVAALVLVAVYGGAMAVPALATAAMAAAGAPALFPVMAVLGFVAASGTLALARGARGPAVA